MTLTPLERAKNVYANITTRLKVSGISARERGFLTAELAKAKTTLKLAYTTTTDTANEAVPTPAVVMQTPAPVNDHDADDPDHRAFCYYCIPGSQQAAVLVDRIYTQWVAHRAFKRRPSAERLLEYRQIIEGVISNVLYAVALDFEGVFVTREQSTLAKRSRYRPAVYNQTLLSVLDDLHAMGVIEQKKGDRWRRDQSAAFRKDATKGRQLITTQFNRTELSAARILDSLRELLHVTRITDVIVQTDRQEVVILRKDETSALLEYTDEEQPKVIKYRQQMQVINRMLDNAGDLLAPGAPATLDQRQRFLVRKFTYSSLQSGGRLWGGFWQNLSKVDRAQWLRIDGQPTIELDFSSVITHLAYIVAGEQPPKGDLYAIHGLSPESRPAVKKLLPALLFKTKPATRYPKGVRELLCPEDRSKPFAHVLDLIHKQHPAIVPLFSTGEGHYLQFLESQLMVNVLLYCDRAGLTALPIHDCIVIPQDQEELGRSMMEIACLRVLGGREIPIKRDR